MSTSVTMSGATCGACGGPGAASIEIDVPGRTMTVPRCPTCQRIGSDRLAVWQDIIATRRPQWSLPWIAWPHLHTPGDYLRPGAGDVSYSGRWHPATEIPAWAPVDAVVVLPGHGRWAHVTDDQLSALRTALERAYWPSRPPNPGGDALPRAAVEAWPHGLACWRCGITVQPGEGSVVEAPSPTDTWVREERTRPLEVQLPNADRQIREKDRATAPRVPGAAWRQCGTCAVDWTMGLVDAAGLDLGSASVVSGAVSAAARQLPAPVYARGRSQLDPGVDTAWSWYDVGWWAERLQALVRASEEPLPRESPSGLPCVVCGVTRHRRWEYVGRQQLCGMCTDLFAPEPPPTRDPITGEPIERRFETREDGRPYNHPRGAWELTWTTVPDPAPDAVLDDDPAARWKWYREHELCDKDLICAYAAGRPNLVQPGLARDVRFYLAHEHPKYRKQPTWLVPFAYLRDNSDHLDENDLAQAVTAVVEPARLPSGLPPAPATRPHGPRIRTAAEIVSDRRAEEMRRAAEAADRARIAHPAR